jgi:hypothetical protein
MILKLFLPKKSAKNWRFWHKTKLIYEKIWSQHWFFEKNANFVRRKLAKIAENCDLNIDPWSHWYVALVSSVGLPNLDFEFWCGSLRRCRRSGWPDWANLRPTGDCLLRAVTWIPHFWACTLFYFHSTSILRLSIWINFDKIWVGLHFVRFFTNSSGHPDGDADAGADVFSK